MIDERSALRVFLGPVQPFIAAGRRTRDFWAGSFLLSLLAGNAMDAVLTRDGTITVPAVGEDGRADRTLRAIRDARGRGIDAAGRYTAAEAKEQWRGPMAGTLVNHFRAEVPSSFDPSAIAAAVRTRFKTIADAIDTVFIEPALQHYAREDRGDAVGSATSRRAKADEIRARWRLQTDGSFFEVLWVKGPGATTEAGWQDEARWLERRKATRTHLPIDEAALALPGTGARCPIHSELCELGGFSRISERAAQDDFWGVLRETVGRNMYRDSGFTKSGEQFRDTLEIREDERLSGLALVKRLFPLLDAGCIVRAIGWVPDYGYDILGPDEAASAKNWDPADAQRTLRNWPSVAFIAAIPWIVVAGRHAGREAADYASRQYAALGAEPILKSERPQRHRIAGIDGLDKVSGPSGKAEVPLFAVLDGTLHFRRGLERHRFEKDAKRARIPGDGARLARELSDHHRQFVKDAGVRIEAALGTAGIKENPAAPFYAMLEMDGDGMGRIFSASRERARGASRALLAFSDGVAGIVRSHDGVLIYAGADDVFAMLPVDTAIDCAQAIRRHWQQRMEEHRGNIGELPTLSGSIVFADYQNALDDVRTLAHARLDQIAKEEMGRDALALAVMKSGGVTAQWASRWDFPDDAAVPQDCVRAGGPPQALFAYASQAADKGAIASRLPHVIRARFEAILDTREGKDDLFDDADLAQLLAKELSDSGVAGRGNPEEEAKTDSLARAWRVVAVLRPYKRDKAGAFGGARRHVGGLLIARFLAENVFWPYYRTRRSSVDGSEGAV